MVIKRRGHAHDWLVERPGKFASWARLRFRDQANARAVAAMAPIRPQTAMTRAGENDSAAAPARIMTRPCPKFMPPCASPKAWLRRAAGAAVTNAALAASWKQPHSPAAHRMTRATHNAGRAANNTKIRQLAIASGPI